MQKFAAIFVPSAAALVAGATPASWTIATDVEGAADQILQRATVKAAEHMAYDHACFGPAEPMDGFVGAAAIFVDMADEIGVGVVHWIPA